MAQAENTVVTESLPYQDVVPGAVIGRDGEALVVDRNKLVELGRYLRDHEGYDYLSSVTGVDNLTHPKRQNMDRFEVVYHLYSTQRGGGPLVLKARAPEDDPEIPSLVPVWPGAAFQEREIWDLFGVRFPGHPNLRRILLWEGFHGHPMRKDWKEAYYEEEHKPFSSRWPKGHYPSGEYKYPWQEERAVYHDNLIFPDGFDPDAWKAPEIEYRLGQDLYRELEGMKTDRIIVNMGPQHPSTHGVFRMIVALEGETILGLEPEMGYLHRNHEKIGERNTYLMNIPYTDRLDYINSMSNNLGYVLAVEKLMGNVKVPERAQYLRVIMAELARWLNHAFAIGFMLNDLGAFFTPSLYALEERELILDLFEAASGSRMMCNYMRPGGVAYDVDEDWVTAARKLVFERLPRATDEVDYYLTHNEIMIARMKGTGYLSYEDAIAYSTSGPVLRGSGVPYDVRKAEPYCIYDRFDFDIVTDGGGDVYGRYMVRLGEMRQSVRILQQALRDLPGGPILPGKKKYTFRIPPGEAYQRVEAPKGELGYYLVSDGTANPYRYHVRAPSFINLTALEPMCVGYKVADSVAILGSIDIVLGEVDR